MSSNLIDGRYEVLGDVGAGAMGRVVRAHDIHLGRDVAIKLVGDGLRDNPAALASFKREATALASLRNDYIVQAFAFGPHDAGYFFAMEFVKGRDLASLIRLHADHGSTIPVFRSVSILRDLASGLAVAHQAGIVHRDVKPTNVMVEEESGRPVLIDFGLAKRAGAGGALNGGGGTPAYMSPEQATRGSALTPASDVYSLAVTAFELLTGELPFFGTSADLLEAHRSEPAPLLSSRRADLKAFDGVIAEALQKDVSRRIPSADAFRTRVLDALERWTTGDPTYRGVARGVAVSLAGEPTRSRLLVVEPDRDAAKVAVRASAIALIRTPAVVVSATSGAQAIEAAAKGMPGVLLLDAQLPDMTAVQLLSVIRSMPGGERVRVLVTGLEALEDRWRYSVLGVQHFLDKRVEMTELVEIIAMLAELAGWRESDTSRSGG